MTSSKKFAAIYFNRRSGNAFKELAARIRAEGAKTTLVWANQFKGPEHLVEEATAVVIQQSLHNADDIAHAYDTLGNQVEVHFADDSGEFVGDEQSTNEEANDPQDSVSADSAVQAEDADEGADAPEADDEPELDTRSDEKFFDDAVAEDEAIDDEGSSDSESSEE
jgi:hypothetical protein